MGHNPEDEDRAPNLQVGMVWRSMPGQLRVTDKKRLDFFKQEVTGNNYLIIRDNCCAVCAMAHHFNAFFETAMQVDAGEFDDRFEGST